MSIFEEVKQQLNIMQVIEHFGFKVNRAKKFICPFHNDHKPSASIKNDYFNCFVCGTGGDLITFTAKYLSISNLEACRELVRAFNLNIDISTAEEKKEQYEAYRRRRNEINKCDTLRDKFNKDKEIRADLKKHTAYKLRAERMKLNKSKEKEQQEYIKRVGYLLDDMHRFWWQGIELYPYGDERHTEGLQELTTCEYYLECYNENPEQFCEEYGEVIKRYEERLNRADKQE